MYLITGVIMFVGLQDDVCPPRTAFATYNKVTSPKEYWISPFSGHSSSRTYKDLKNKWIAERLGVEEKGL